MSHPEGIVEGDRGAHEGVAVGRLEAFLRQLSHDVRNDLNAMELLISLVEDDHSEEEVRSALLQLHEAVRYGARRMLRVSRAVQIPDLECIVYPVEILAEDLRDRIQRERPEVAARMEWIGSAQCESVAVDAGLVVEALTELIENACGFSSVDTPVCCRVAPLDGGVVWYIEQHAPAPPVMAEQWGRTPLVSSRRGHYGLGLYRVRRILQAHRASLSYRYEPETHRIVAEVFFAGSGA